MQSRSGSDRNEENMKNTAYKIYAMMFNLYSALPLKADRVVLLSPHMAKFTDSLGEVENEFKARGGYKTVRISGTDIKPVKAHSITEEIKNIARMVSFFTKKARLLATSKYIFLNDNFMPMSDLKFKKDAVITQLWHAEGVFKKFGLDLQLPDDVRNRVAKGNRRVDYLICSSVETAKIYSKALGVPLERTLPLGSPRADKYMRNASLLTTKADFAKKHGIEASKGIILYAPTFRDKDEDNRRILEYFDFDRFNERFGEKYTLILRLHPQIHNGIKVPGSVIDMTDIDDAGELIKASDILITDYSSICMDFALLGKPSIFYAYDLDSYNSDRQFYIDYKSYVPGTVAMTFDELLDAVENPLSDKDKTEEFMRFNFSVTDGKAAERIVDLVTQGSSL